VEFPKKAVGDSVPVAGGIWECGPAGTLGTCGEPGNADDFRAAGGLCVALASVYATVEVFLM
jgi:hypothetical protein